jgi:hypothetical protein
VAVILCPAGIFAQAGLVHAVVTGNERLVIAFIMPALISLVAWLVAGVMMVESRRQNRSRGQLPPPSARRGPALDGEWDGGTGDDLILCEVHKGARARHMLDHRFIRRAWWSEPMIAMRGQPSKLVIRRSW